MKRISTITAVLAGLALSFGPRAPAIVQACDCPHQGDYDQDGFLTALDLGDLIDVLFGGHSETSDPACPISRGDFDASGFPDAIDLGLLIDHLFAGGRPPFDPCLAGGAVIGHSGCKPHGKSAAIDPITPEYDCVTYEYDGQSILTLHHINTAFNCCPDSLTAEFQLAPGTVVIDEAEWLTDFGCLCLCLYDMDYRITGLPPGTYTIDINGMYVGENEPQLEFTVDLTTATSGQFCVYRGENYPWGPY